MDVLPFGTEPKDAHEKALPPAFNPVSRAIAYLWIERRKGNLTAKHDSLRSLPANSHKHKEVVPGQHLSSGSEKFPLNVQRLSKEQSAKRPTGLLAYPIIFEKRPKRDGLI